LSLRPATPAFASAAGIPHTKGTGLICRFPSPGLSPTRLGLLTLGTCVGSGYGCDGSIPTRFSWAPGLDRTPLNGGLFLPSPGSHRYGTPQALTVEQGDDPARPTPKRHAWGLASPRVPSQYWNIDQFPFRRVMLTLALGPTNSRLTTHCLETLALPAIGILTRLCCYYRRDLQSRPVHGTSRPRFGPIGTPSYRTASSDAALGYRGLALDPSIFGAPSLGG
jgi:hypothetical protein